MLDDGFQPASIDWHQRFLLQSAWTRPLREYFFSKFPPENFHHVLEVGCGTGVIAAELETRFSGKIFGVDIELSQLAEATYHTSRCVTVCGDAHALPFCSESFDLVCCHFLLLWLKDPLRALQEMARITRPGGIVAAFAEPDYLARIDHPEALNEVNRWQIESLRIQGANPKLGRELKSLFFQARLQEIHSGILGAEWLNEKEIEDWQSEWEVIYHDLKYLPEPPSPSRIKALQELDLTTRKQGERVLFVPVFFAWGTPEKK